MDTPAPSALNSELSQRVDAAPLAAAEAGLGAAIADEPGRQRAARLVRPPS